MCVYVFFFEESKSYMSSIYLLLRFVIIYRERTRINF